MNCTMSDDDRCPHTYTERYYSYEPDRHWRCGRIKGHTGYHQYEDGGGGVRWKSKEVDYVRYL